MRKVSVFWWPKYWPTIVFWNFVTRFRYLVRLFHQCLPMSCIMLYSIGIGIFHCIVNIKLSQVISNKLVTIIPPSVGIVLKPMPARASPTGLPDPGRSVPEDDHRLVLVSGLRSYSLSRGNQETRKYFDKEINSKREKGGVCPKIITDLMWPSLKDDESKVMKAH